MVLIALGQTRKSNQISAAQTDLAARTARQQLRAHIGVAETELITPSEESGAGEAVFQLKNFGGSAALRMEASLAIATVPHRDGTLNVPTEWELVGKKLAVDVPPSATAFRRMVLPNSATEYLEELKAGTRALWVSLSIEYFDIFGAKHSQKTMFGSRGRYFREELLMIWVQEPEQTEEPEADQLERPPFWRRWLGVHVPTG